MESLTSTVSENEAEERIEKMLEGKASLRGGSRDHRNKKQHEDVDARLRKANKKSKARKTRFDEDSDYDDESDY